MNRDVFSLDSVSYRGIAKDLLRGWWVILAFALAVWVGVSGLGSLTYTPRYSASSTLVVSVKGNADTYASLSVATQVTDVIGEIFQSEVMKELVQEETGESMTASISCSQVKETNLLVVTATADNPRDAYLFLNAALKHYDEVSDYVFANASLQILQEPSVPMAPSNQPRFVEHRNLLAVLAAAGMALVIVVFYMLRYTLKSSGAAAKQLDGTVLGVIPYEKNAKRNRNKKAKEALLIHSPIVSMHYAEACRRIETQVMHHLNKKKQQVLLIASVSENEGKSTIAANIALSLADKYKKVLLIDGDFRKPAQHKVFDKEPSKESPLLQVLSGERTLREAMTLNKKTGVYELFLNHAIQHFDAAALEGLIEEARDYMDYIIIDCSPTAVSTDAEEWMQVADSALLVVREDWSDVRVINDTVDIIWQSGCEFAGFILNAFEEEGRRKAQAYGYESYGAHGAYRKEAR